MKVILATAMLACTAGSASAATLFTCHDELPAAMGLRVLADATYLVDREGRAVRRFDIVTRAVDRESKQVFYSRVTQEDGTYTVAMDDPRRFMKKPTPAPGTYRDKPFPFTEVKGILQVLDRGIDLRSGLSKIAGATRISRCSMAEQRT